MFAGTSTSAPHVTGALALLLQRNPTTDPETALGKLVASAGTDAFTGPTWDTASGWGKLDAARLVAPELVPVTARCSGSSPPPTGGPSSDGRRRTRILWFASSWRAAPGATGGGNGGNSTVRVRTSGWIRKGSRAPATG